ncbi:hypothetical protein VitviT2T_019688 [Vitis vinifera]|uniref:Retrovirus-related Pol polyprotein from transposon 17.6 n=1 Tax=Vitis vinifera TaxID=29760 RepID=A0ABY9D458_VITVI|nr:hypothetical protein VitviT2T_019688 [Vitis vinifera]
MSCSICQSFEHLVEECPTIPAVREMFGDQANAIGQFKPNNNASYGNTYNSNWRNHPNFSWKPRAPQYTQPGQAPPQASNLEQAIMNLSKVMGDFVGDQKSINAQLSQRIDSVENPVAKGTNYVPIILGRAFLATSNAIINCRNGVMQLTFGNMTLELNIFYLCKKQFHPEEEERPEEVCMIDNLVEEHCDQKMLEDLNKSLGDLDERRCKKAIEWKISDLKGINPLVCTHHIYMEEEAKLVRQPQRRLNPHMQEVVRAEVLKLLQADIIYPISDSPWVSPTQAVTKKSGITVVQNDKGEEVSTRFTSGWRVCIDYRKLNAVTRKDHFPLPFIGQVLKRVSGHPFYYFLDGYSGYFQIEIDVEDQEKTTFTCPFGIYAYRRMFFDLCNAPATFQRYTLRIFSDMVERIMEVFMDDITIYRSAFDEYLVNLEVVLNRCIEKYLVLNWEKCHFMVHQGIVLGHIISKQGIEVDKAKDAKFVWDDRCQWSFEELKLFLTTAPIVRAPNWQFPFEVMCDASDFAIGAVLRQREDGEPYVIYYASKMLNEAQINYTTTEKELLVVVFALDKFRAYLVGSFIVAFTYHSAFKYLLTKQDAKARLIGWILLLQEFNLQIKDKKGVENVVVDHLSRLAIAHNSHSLPINDDFLEESLILMEVAPWYAHISNYLVIGEVPSEWKTQDKKHFFAKIHAYYWEEPFLFKYLCGSNNKEVRP